MILGLPFPPAVNNLFATFNNRRIRTRRYEAWLSEAGAQLMAQNPPRITGPFRVTITAVRPDLRRRDLDGILKAPLDLLVKHGIVEDDSKASSILLMWSASGPVKGGALSIIVEPASAPAIMAAAA
jgi:crossover junction endodeoxyribonuclease RusA